MNRIGNGLCADSSGFVVDQSSGRVHLIPCGLDDPERSGFVPQLEYVWDPWWTAVDRRD